MLVNLEDIAQHFEWMMKWYIKHEPEIMWRFSLHPDLKKDPSGPRRLQQAYDLVEKEENGRETAAKVAAAGIPRNRDPFHYTRMFSWRDAHGMTRLSDPKEAQKTLDAVSKPNPEYDQFQADMEAIAIGTRYHETAGRKEAREWGLWAEGDVVSTHTELEIPFDPEIDTIPGNPSWQYKREDEYECK